MEVKTAIAKRLSDLMDDEDLSAEQLAQKARVPLRVVELILKDGYQSVSVEKVFFLCRAMGYSLFDFFDDDLFETENLKGTKL